MIIAVDVMSGDKSPQEIIKGALSAAEDFEVKIVLIGDEDVVSKYADDSSGVSVVFSTQVITMEDDPLSAIKEKEDSSLAVGIKLVKNGDADAFVSPGNTGALLSAASIRLRRVKGIRRAAIGTVVPLDKPFIMVDAGANIDVLAENLCQFGYMGALYAEKVLGVKKPRVALLSNGTEETKGLPVTKEAYRMLKETELNFMGNVESRELPFGCCDVLVCDGFTGNITLKLIEGMGKFMSQTIKSVFKQNFLTKLAYLPCKKNIKKLRKKMDSRQTGGAPLLGVAKPVIKAHGNSDSVGIYNAIRLAKAYTESGIIKEFEKKFGRVNADGAEN
ncbi:MAG: phosphate acyltransferase PlsX [Clostridia bacterium]|nr:phosphate acyltransferase PlsX [Clostridia bacterium]